MKPTAKKLLQELLDETQKEKRKIMEAYRHLEFRESNLKKAIKEINEKNI